jgi:hypothetical protein
VAGHTGSEGTVPRQVPEDAVARPGLVAGRTGSEDTVRQQVHEDAVPRQVPEDTVARPGLVAGRTGSEDTVPPPPASRTVWSLVAPDVVKLLALQ